MGNIFAWAIEGDFDSRELKSNLFSMEWPPKSGRMQEFPEVDRAMWLRPIDAIHKIAKGQRPILEELFHRLGIDQNDYIVNYPDMGHFIVTI